MWLVYYHSTSLVDLILQALIHIMVAVLVAATVFELSRLWVKVFFGALTVFALFAFLAFWVYTDFSESSNMTFNQEVLAKITEFKGSSICLPDGLQVKGTYTLDDVQVANTTVKVAVNLNTKFDTLAYTCTRGLYMGASYKFNDLLKAAARDAVSDNAKNLESSLKNAQVSLSLTASTSKVVVTSPPLPPGQPTLALNATAGKAEVPVKVNAPPKAPEPKKSPVAVDTLISGQ